MLAILILTIAFTGISSTYVSGRRFVVCQQYYQTAAQLASEKFEDLKTFSYDDIGVGEEEEEFSVDGQPYLRQTQIELTMDPTAEVPKPCKKVTVTIQWSLYGTDIRQASLVTYIGP
jgi:hypothetical protein